MLASFFIFMKWKTQSISGGKTFYFYVRSQIMGLIGVSWSH